MKGLKVKRNFQCVSKLHSVIKQDPDIYMVKKNCVRIVRMAIYLCNCHVLSENRQNGNISV